MENYELALSMLGRAINELYQAGKGTLSDEIDFDNLIKKALITSDAQKFQLWGAINILHVLGLITINSKGRIRIVSRQANFVLGSISKYCKAEIQVVDDPMIDEQESRYLVGHLAC